MSSRLIHSNYTLSSNHVGACPDTPLRSDDHTPNVDGSLIESAIVAHCSEYDISQTLAKPRPQAFDPLSSHMHLRVVKDISIAAHAEELEPIPKSALTIMPHPSERKSIPYQSSTFNVVGAGCPGADAVLQLSGLWPSGIPSKLACHMPDCDWNAADPGCRNPLPWFG